jgi:hypothetical protein
MAEGIIGRAANKLKQLFEPEDPLSGFNRKGRPYTAMTDQELANVSYPALDELRARAQNPERFQMTPRQFLEPYYGANLDKEIEAARAQQTYQSGAGSFSSVYRGVYKQDYDKIDQPVNIEIQQDPQSQYPPSYLRSENFAQLNSPDFPYKSQLYSRRLISTSPKVQDWINSYMKENLYMPEEVAFRARNPMSDLLETAEHEVGHAFTSAGQVSAKDPRIKDKSHLAKPVEMANALGKIQRDTYSIFGKRFDDKSLSAFIEKERALKPEERFKDYSIESKRGLRQIMEFYDKRKEEEPWQWVKDNIGKFVQTPKPKTQPTA